jgi:hypothetical protein
MAIQPKTVICHFYNEEFLLPWWLKHHKHLFDHGIMIDYGSTDSSVAIIKNLCPTWTIRPSRNAFFDPKLIDEEVMEVEKELTGWRIALNVTEFIYGDFDRLHNLRGNWTSHLLANYVFVDMEDDEKGPLELTHMRPLHEQRYWGYFEPYGVGQLTAGSTSRMNRSIHNFALEYPDWGRHWPDTDYTLNDLAIFYYGWADMGEEGIKRRTQILDKVRPEHRDKTHHRYGKNDLVHQHNIDHKNKSMDLRDDIEVILAHNKRITKQRF